MSQVISFPGLQWLLRTGGFGTIQTPRFLRRRCLREVGILMWLTACIEIGLTHELHAIKTEAHERGLKQTTKQQQPRVRPIHGKLEDMSDSVLAPKNRAADDLAVRMPLLMLRYGQVPLSVRFRSDSSSHHFTGK